MSQILLSKKEADIIVQAHRDGKSRATTSLDFGLTKVEVRLEADTVCFSGDACISIRDLDEICDSPQKCFIFENNQFQQIHTFSELDNKAYSLMPTSGAPTLLVSGISMHRFKDVDPWGDARLDRLVCALPQSQV